nr:hypothetical protein [Tanacetum cinerariifolium]
MILKAYDSSNPPQTNRKLNDNIILEGCSDQHDEEENGKSVYVAWLNKIQKYKKRQDEAFEKVVEFMEPYAISQEHLDSMMAMSKLQAFKRLLRNGDVVMVVQWRMVMLSEVMDNGHYSVANENLNTQTDASDKRYSYEFVLKGFHKQLHVSLDLNILN